ncbi:hypothetical protein NBRC10513v2_004992 [Rhodotorula toruloides]
MDTFAYQPPNTHSPGRYASSPSAGPADPSSSSFAPRPGSSSGAHASGGFTATLPPLQEHASTDVSSANGSGAVGGTRPTLVEFEQLAGEDAFGGIGGEMGDAVYGQSGFGGAASGVGFREPFARPGSTGGQAQAGAGGGMFAAGLNGASSQSPSHAYFNPQTINPSVNTRNTRPMTAPSGHGYIGSHSYSAAPSNFYAPAQPTGPPGVFDSFHGAPPHTAVPPGPSSFQYQVDSNPHAAEFDSYRARGFSLPDVNGNTMGMGVDPLVQVTEGTSPPSSTPFFYTPPAVQTVRPMTTGGMFYPAVLDPHASAVMPAPLMGAPGSVLPPGVPFGPYSSDTSRPGSSSGAALTARRRSSGGTTATAASGKQYNFVQQGGQVTKRPRRRYDEIERMYNCDYPGCTKAYGTLNHLNSHKTMQKHGPKSTPAQFKEIRKAWRERKKAEAAAAARAQAAGPPQHRGQGPAPNGVVPPLVPIPGSNTDRPRPSTSAGEYHVTMAVPYMSAGGAPSVLPYDAAAGPTASTLPLARGQHVGPLDAQLGMYGGPVPSSFSAPFDPYGNRANRPVTAPSYYVAPSFGSIPPQHPLASQSTASHQPSPLGPGTTSVSARYMNPLSSTLGAAASADRRFSLPVSSLGSSAPFQLPPPPATAGSLPPPPPLSGTSTTDTPASPEMKMPQPMPPTASFALLASSSGPGGVGGGAAEEVSAQ